MMIRQIVPIVFIYLCTSATWIVLGTTVSFRTQTQDDKLRSAVGQLWGHIQKQQAPKVFYAVRKDGNENDAPTGPNDTRRPYLWGLGAQIPLQATDLSVHLNIEHRTKGLLWYPTYRVSFAGKYRLRNPTVNPATAAVVFRFPAKGAVYDDFGLRVGGQEISDLSIDSDRVNHVFRLGPSQSEIIEIRYRSRGMDEWWYDFGASVIQIKNFSLKLDTDFERIDFPQNSISPTKKEKTATGWSLIWNYSNLLSSVKIGISLPRKLNPGPWVAQVSYAAPISLFLFFFLLFVLSTVQKIPIHPMNYFFIGAAYFSFHLLLAYLVDHLSVPLAFALASLVSVFLVASYMRLVVGPRIAYLQVGVAQFVYLVLFSYSFFYAGYTGLAITILCVFTLFLMMQITGDLDWDEVLRRDQHPEGPPDPISQDIETGV